MVNNVLVIIDKDDIAATVREYDNDNYMGIGWDQDSVKDGMLTNEVMWIDRNKLYKKSEVKILNSSNYSKIKYHAR